MTGLAEVKNGLYHLIKFYAATQKEIPNSNKSFLANTSTISLDIWHFRLGHLSSAKLKLISSKISHNHVCEICPLARQKKNYLFLYHKTIQIKHLNQYIVIFGVHSPLSLILAINSLLLLWMIIHDLLNFFLRKLNQKLEPYLPTSLLMLRLSLILKYKHLKQTMVKNSICLPFIKKMA